MSDNQDVLRAQLEEMEWGALRKHVREAGISVLPDHTKDHLISAYLEKARKTTIYHSAEKGSPIKPGYIRINLAAGDSTFVGVAAGAGTTNVSGQSDAPVDFCHNGANGFFCLPRNVEVDIPKHKLSCIKNATAIKLFKDEATNMPVLKQGPAYHYSIVGEGPPADLIDKGARHIDKGSLKHKGAFLREHGRFPTDRDMLIAKNKPLPDIY